MDWRKEMAVYLTGEVNKYDADTFYLRHKDFYSGVGYNILGQYQGVDYKWYIWVGVNVPEGYSNIEAGNNLTQLFTAHADAFPGVKVKQNYSEGIGRWGVIFVTDNDPSDFINKMVDIASLNDPDNPLKPDDGNTTNYLTIGAVAFAAILLVVFLFAKGGKR